MVRTVQRRPASSRKTGRKARSKVNVGDVFEYAPSKVRRANVSLSLDRHEERDGRRYDEDGDELGVGRDAMEKLRASMIDGENVDSDEDEDIASDDAFEESDREAFAGSGITKKTAVEVDLNEEEKEEDEDEQGDFFDALDVFDGRVNVEDDEKEREEAEWKGTEDVGMSEEEEEEEEDDDNDDDNDDDDDDELRISASDAEDASPEALADLETFLSGLDPSSTPQKRKPDADAEPSTKRRRIVDRTQAGEENVFGVKSASTLKLDDLLAPLADPSALKKSTKPLTSSNPKTKTLSAPLPQRAQERLDREAAYEKTKEEVDKWSATMKRIKEADHLSFPLQAEKPSRVSNLSLAANFTPSNPLENAVDRLLKSAQLRDEDVERTEALKMAHLSVEDVAARRAELRTMRELVFRADRKAKRIAKIKSKVYRRLRKKQRERLDGPEGAEADGEGEEEDEEGRLKAEVRRARERATLRHKNTGKWAKAMKGREGLDQDQRQAIGEMLDRGERLRRRIRGEDSGEEDGEESESEGEQDEEMIKRGAFEELTALRTEDDADPEFVRSSKSVFGMKFMRDAAARRSRDADAQAETLEKEMGFGIVEDEGDGTIQEDGAVMVERVGGRLSFRPGAMAAGVLKPLGSLASDTSSVTLQSADLLQDVVAPDPTPTPSGTPTPISTPTIAPPPVLNPWLMAAVSSGPARKRNEVRVHKDANALAKSSNKLKKQAEKGEEEKERAREDAVLVIDANNVLAIPDDPPKKKGGTKTRSDQDGNESDVASEIEEQEQAAEKSKRAGKMRAFQQRELVALAFAGDNVVEAFEEAKRQETEGDAPREVDTTLPGWGSWGGTGTKKRPAKRNLIKTVPGIAPAARADHAKPHVIISEKRDKKAAKYLVRDVPHPYTSHAQFERRMATPLGTEWNTRVGFQRATLPRVVKKMGVVIDPLEKLF